MTFRYFTLPWTPSRSRHLYVPVETRRHPPAFLRLHCKSNPRRLSRPKPGHGGGERHRLCRLGIPHGRKVCHAAMRAALCRGPSRRLFSMGRGGRRADPCLAKGPFFVRKGAHILVEERGTGRDGKLFVWAVLACVLLSLWTGRAEAAADALLDCGSAAVALALTLAGAYCLWCGVLEVMERAGLTARLARALRPLFAKAFFPGLACGRPGGERHRHQLRGQSARHGKRSHAGRLAGRWRPCGAARRRRNPCRRTTCACS